MNIEQAIAIFERVMRLRDPALLTPECCEIALEALRGQAEREGCVWCKEDNKVFHDGQHFRFFCSYCGKRLEVNNG